jgi:glycine oxidase
MLAPVGEATWREEPLVRAALASHAMWDDFAAELRERTGLDSGLREIGAVHVALDGDEARELKRRFDLIESLGLDASWLPGRECRSLQAGLGPAAFAGIDAPHESAVDPGALLAALRAACEAAGVEVMEGAEAVAAIEDGGALRGVVASDGTDHRADTTVIAAGAWSRLDWLPEQARPPVRPVKGQILTLKVDPAFNPIDRIVVTERVYLVPRPDGRLIVGATVEELGFDTRVTAGGVLELLREAYRVVPDVAELELEEASAGLRPGTSDNAPLVGPTGTPGLLWATGHYRNGILLAPITAAAVVAHLANEEPPPDFEAADPGRFAEVAS